MFEINNKLLNDIKEYCSYNDIEDVSGYINRLLKKSFMEEKYGKKPDIFNKQEKQVTNEVSNKPIEENKIDIVEETPKLVNKEVPKESNSINLESLNIKEETKQKTEEIEKPKKSNRRKLS